jgi:hypothetical protein
MRVRRRQSKEVEMGWAQESVAVAGGRKCPRRPGSLLYLQTRGTPQVLQAMPHSECLGLRHHWASPANLMGCRGFSLIRW